MTIRRLTPDDAAAFQALRLSALQDAPTAFGSSYEEEKDFPVAMIEGRLAFHPDRGVFGAFVERELVGLVALGRDNKKKLEHKALIWGLYVSPSARGKGLGRRLLLQALALAKSVSGISQANLSVNARNAHAIQLYESLGFKSFGQEPSALIIDGEHHDEMHMCLRLTES